MNKFSNRIWNRALKRVVLKYGFQLYRRMGGYPVLGWVEIL